MLKRVLLLSICAVFLCGLSYAQMSPLGHCVFQPSGSVSCSAYAGWLFDSTGMTLNTRLINFNQEFLDRNALHGYWRELVVQGSCSDRLGFLISGGILAPSECNGTEREIATGAESAYSLSGTAWGSVQGLMTYGLSEDFLVIGGFRWDHFNTRIDYSETPSFLDFKLNSYVPLIGVQSNLLFFGGSLVTRLIGWPGPIPGHITQSYVGWPQVQASDDIEQDLNRGYLIECFTEYRTTLFRNASAGIFVQWSNLHVTTGEDTYDWMLLGTRGTGPVTQTFDRRAWTIGGSLTFDFTLPKLL